MAQHYSGYIDALFLFFFKAWLSYIDNLYVDNFKAQVSEFVSRVFLFIILASIFLVFLYFAIVEPAFKKAFEEKTRSCNALVKIYGKGREFYRYILFRGQLKQQRFNMEDVEKVNLLL